eukprot:scaffold1863_cov85-Cylindrotheca_fusiformis.AAC.13
MVYQSEDNEEGRFSYHSSLESSDFSASPTGHLFVHHVSFDKGCPNSGEYPMPALEQLDMIITQAMLMFLRHTAQEIACDYFDIAGAVFEKPILCSTLPGPLPHAIVEPLL